MPHPNSEVGGSRRAGSEMPRYGVLPYNDTSQNTVIMNLSICSPSSSQLIFIYSAWMMCEQMNQTQRLGDGFSCLVCVERDKQADFVVGHREVHGRGQREQEGSVLGGGETRGVTVTFTRDSG